MFLEKSVSGIILTSRKTAEQQKNVQELECSANAFHPLFNVSSNSKSVMHAYRLLYCTNDESGTQENCHAWKICKKKFANNNSNTHSLKHFIWFLG